MTDVSIEELAGDGVPMDSDFGKMLDDFSYDMPKRGQVLEGTLLSVTQDEVIVDVGLKRDAFVPRQDLERLPDDVRDALETGQAIKVAVLRAYDREGELIVSINKALAEKDWDRAVECLEQETLLEVKVVDTNKGGLLVRFGQLRGFLPQSHIISLPRGGSSTKRADEMDGMVGEMLNVKIIEITRERNRLIFSERAAHQEALRQTLDNLTPGTVVKGQVVHLKSYGAFVDIGNNVTGLVHVSDLDWIRVEHPADVVTVGDELELEISRVDAERGRVSLNRKSQLPNPWDSIKERYAEGDLITGRVSNVTDFGLFVSLPGGLDGLVHVSQLASYGATHPGELARRGDLLPVRVLRIDSQRERIALSLDAVTTEEQLEWMETRYEDGEGNEPVAVAVEGLEDSVAAGEQEMAASEEDMPVDESELVEAVADADGEAIEEEASEEVTPVDESELVEVVANDEAIEEMVEEEAAGEDMPVAESELVEAVADAGSEAEEEAAGEIAESPEEAQAAQTESVEEAPTAE